MEDESLDFLDLTQSPGKSALITSGRNVRTSDTPSMGTRSPRSDATSPPLSSHQRALFFAWAAIASLLLGVTFALTIVSLIRSSQPFPPIPTALPLGGQLGGITSAGTVLYVGNYSASQINTAVNATLNPQVPNAAIGFVALTSASAAVNPGATNCFAQQWNTYQNGPFIIGNYGIYGTSAFNNATGIYTVPATASYVITLNGSVLPVPGGSSDRQGYTFTITDIRQPLVVTTLYQSYNSVPGSFTKAAVQVTGVQRLVAGMQLQMCLNNMSGEILSFAGTELQYSIERLAVL